MFLALNPATLRRLSTHSSALSTLSEKQLGLFFEFLLRLSAEDYVAFSN
jgi:hypothetical protein